MLETPHALTGAAVGALTGNVYGAGAAGFASHLAGDLMPHWNPKWPFRSKPLYGFVIADFVVAEGLVIALWLLFPDRPEIAVGAFFGTVPDIILGLRYVFKIRWLQGYERVHAAMNTDKNIPVIAGLVPQVLISAGAIWYVSSLLD